MKLKLELLILGNIVLVSGMLSFPFFITSCSNKKIPQCPNTIIIGDYIRSGTVHDKLLNPFYDEWYIKSNFKPEDILNEKKYPDNLIKWDIACQYSYALRNLEYGTKLIFTSFERYTTQVKYSLSLIKADGATTTTININTAEFDTPQDEAEFAPINITNCDQEENTNKLYKINSVGSTSENSIALGILMGDQYKYAMSLFLAELDFSSTI